MFVLVDETRPRLQGARLTAWELKQYGIPFKVITDSASGHYMRTSNVDLCVVGADRVAGNGDTANKIGTYNLALSPMTMVCLSMLLRPLYHRSEHHQGDDIPIEERPAQEITHVGDCQITPDDVDAGNPAFDVTPAKYITAIITERGVAYPPFEASLAALMAE